MSSFKPTIPDTETAITEITFLPDGRVCLFGASTQVLELLGELNLGDAALNHRLAAIHDRGTAAFRPAAVETTALDGND